MYPHIGPELCEGQIKFEPNKAKTLNRKAQQEKNEDKTGKRNVNGKLEKDSDTKETTDEKDVLSLKIC